MSALNFFAALDQQWLQNIISDKEKESKQVNGALVSECLSDAFVLVAGIGMTYQSIKQMDFNLLSYKTLVAVQLGAAGFAIKSLLRQKTKIDNDLHVLNAILELDAETPENITSMLRDYIKIHADPDAPEKPTGFEVKSLSNEALLTIQKNFRVKKEQSSFVRKIGKTALFLRHEFANAAKMVVHTVTHPLQLAKSVVEGTLILNRIRKNWDNIQVNKDALTTRERILYDLRHAETNPNADTPKTIKDMLGEGMSNRINYLHQQQASLRNVTRLRLETKNGLIACGGIIGLAFVSLGTAPTLGVAGMAIYTIVASLPSLKVMCDELVSLTKTNDMYSPMVATASNDFTASMAKMRLG